MSIFEKYAHGCHYSEVASFRLPQKKRQQLYWKFIYSGLKCKASAGVGIALSPDAKLVDYDDSIIEGRILLVHVILHGIRISAVCAYGEVC